MKKILIYLCLILSVSGCGGKPINVTSKGDFEVEYLFEQDGIKVYRFIDYGHMRYFTTRGDTFWSEESGKRNVPVGIPWAD